MARVVHVLAAIAIAVLLAPSASTILARMAPGDETESEANSPPVGPITTYAMDVVAMECPLGYDNGHQDNVCLAYDGVIPGPGLVVEAFGHTQVTINNRIADTIDSTSAAAPTRDALREARVSWHRHGVHVQPGMDGVDTPPGSAITDSTVAPNDSFTYASQHRYVGGWHYHDHVMFTQHNGGIERGLFGAILVVPPGQVPDHLFDLHLLDAGPNGGLGMDATVDQGDEFVIALAGLGNAWWTVVLYHPDGSTLFEASVGPGTSTAWRIRDADEGAYTWQALNALQPGTTFEGKVTAQ